MSSHRFRQTFLVPVLVLVLAVGVALAVPTARAASSEGSGWWDRNGGVAPLAPTAPPEDVLRIGRDPVGVSAIAAVRFSIDPDEALPTLVLRVLAGTPTADAGEVIACPATSAWEPSAGEPLREAPAYDCGLGQVSGVKSPDATTIVFGLHPFVQDGIIDVVLLPEVAAADVLGTFSLDVAAPTDDDLVTERRQPPAEDGAGGAAPSATSTTTVVAATPSPPVTQVPPEQTFVPPTIAPPPATVEAAAPPPAAASPSVAEFAAPAAAVDRSPASRLTALALAAAALLAGAASVGVGRGASSEETTGGVGRFARARAADPTAIS